jgi:hypothetical protein
MPVARPYSSSVVLRSSPIRSKRIFCLATVTTHKAIDPKLYQEDLLLKELEVDTVLVESIPDPDTLYLMYAPDVAQFKEALKKEGSKHTRKGHWEIHRRTEVPSHCWQFGPRQESTRVRCPSTRQD